MKQRNNSSNNNNTLKEELHHNQRPIGVLRLIVVEEMELLVRGRSFVSVLFLQDVVVAIGNYQRVIEIVVFFAQHPSQRLPQREFKFFQKNKVA